MAGFTVQRSGFIYASDLFLSIVSDLMANGFTLKFPAQLPQAQAGTPVAPFHATLEASASVDPLNADQPWRIHFDAIKTQRGSIHVTSALQLPDDGTVATLATDGVSSGTPMKAGMLTSVQKLPMSGGTDDTPEIYFIDRVKRVDDKATAEAYPFSYRLSITARGFMLFVWEDASDNEGTRHSWVCVQRPVDRITGIPLSEGHCPMFCVFGLEGKAYKFVVREKDVLKPTLTVPADKDTEDSKAIINSEKQVAWTEDNRYVISFPNGLNTQRYMYTQEIDMFGYTSADAVSAYTDVETTLYGESAPRKYVAMNANGPFNTGMRILMLKQGGGID